MPDAATITAVLEELDTIIDESIHTNSRLGLFAYIYRRTTAEIANEISLGHFKDNRRLEALDVTFANLYINAYRGYNNNLPISDSWFFAFKQAEEPLTILQHILLGMNAHINLDLAIATATTMHGIDIIDIEDDFIKVNDILQQITNELQDRLSRVSPAMFLLDAIGNNNDEKVIDFSMRKAREQSWNAANLIWSLGEDQKTLAIKNIDQLVLQISEHIRRPKTRIIRFLLRNIQRFEENEVGLIISKLKAN